MKKQEFSTTVQTLIDVVREQTGPVIPISKFDDFPALPSSKTIRNKKSLGQIPADCFVKEKTKRVLVLMDKYLSFWGASLS